VTDTTINDRLAALEAQYAAQNFDDVRAIAGKTGLELGVAMNELFYEGLYGQQQRVVCV
jgi:hypothetical protein